MIRANGFDWTDREHALLKGLRADGQRLWDEEFMVSKLGGYHYYPLPDYWPKIDERIDVDASGDRPLKDVPVGTVITSYPGKHLHRYGACYCDHVHGMYELVQYSYQSKPQWVFKGVEV